MSPLKAKIKLADAEVRLERGLITPDQYEAIRVECGMIVGRVESIPAIGEGIQLPGPSADQPPVATHGQPNQQPDEPGNA